MTDLAVGIADAAASEDRISLFRPLRLRGLELRNRLWLSPMCQYSAVDGRPGDWHLAHLGDRASGGWGLLFTEATAVSPEGRISAADTGIWTDAQADAWARVVGFVHDRGAPIALQLGHAGRKASLASPWSGRAGTVPVGQGGWQPRSVDARPVPGLAVPRPLERADLAEIVRAFADAAARGVRAGFDAVELLAGHGFLLHSFLSPLTNGRGDEYGVGGEGGRERLLHEVVRAVRAAIPDDVPLLVRLSATDWLPGGLTIADTVAIIEGLTGLGVDLVDVSSGGLLPAEIPVAPGYQVAAAAEIRARTGTPTAAVGLITDARQADGIVRSGSADAVLMGRAAIRDPYFALRAAHELGEGESSTWQPQYARGAWA
ncbi:NADH:flavin oxidoreductase/NADH oxidase [Agromyces allii]|uniref:NADH:flavin oxidoreductase/NADH oxidase n=1 Tax=Agromyces allii TaxID=393607 RepID=A0ABP5CMM3_9MICO|nr:NADH:flavin oxidoreductase/NADH oxidase [Agromyces allii]